MQNTNPNSHNPNSHALPFLLVCAIDNGMTLKIDNVGRIVLPKPVRERLGLRAGMELEVSEGPDGLLLHPLRRTPSMIRRDGLWVHQGKLLVGNLGVGDWVRLDREERMRRLGGW
jgi:AbrB family looped-hinge helix DNA binding protein